MADGPPQRSLAVLFGVLFIVMVGFSIMFPVLPQYATEMGASPLVLGLLMASYSTMQFLFAPVWGRTSDRIGRKPVLLVGLAGFAVAFTIFGLARSLAVLFVARSLAGILSSATLPTAMAYIADITGEDDRAGGMGVLGAAMGLGVVFGPALGGVLARYGLSVPFFAAAGLAGLTILLAAAFLPESLPAGGRQALARAAAGAPAPAVGGVGAGWRGAAAGVATSLRGPLGPLYLVAFVVSVAVAILEGTFGLFVLERLGLTAERQGWLFFVLGVVMAVVQGLLIRPLTRRFGERRLVRTGLVLSAAGFALVLAARDLASAALLLTVFAVGAGLLRPSVVALISKHAPGGQGETLGVMSSLDSLGRMTGPPLGGLLYGWWYQAPYWLGAALHLAALALFVGVAAGRLRPGPSPAD